MALFPLLVLAACADAATDPPVEDACGASDLSEFVGQDVSALAAMTFPDRTRFIRPGDAVTMDYSAERLNVDLSETDTILRFWCG